MDNNSVKFSICDLNIFKDGRLQYVPSKYKIEVDINDLHILDTTETQEVTAEGDIATTNSHLIRFLDQSGRSCIAIMRTELDANGLLEILGK